MIVSTAIVVSSLDDPRVAGYHRIADQAYLQAERVFVAEGRLVVRRLLSSPGWQTQSVLVTPAAYHSLATVFAESASTPIYIADHSILNGIAGFNIHRGCLALAARPESRLLTGATLTSHSRVLILEGVNNPDNVGGIFRSAAAFGVDLVVLGPNCGDPLYRKAVRTSMAAVLEVPFVSAGAWPDAVGLVRAAGFTVIALTPAADAAPLPDVPTPASRLALLVGAEGEGLTVAALDAADLRVRIPMTTRVDSLNVTTAASIALYHVFGASDDYRTEPR